MKKIRVLIVDDSKLIRDMFTQMLNEAADIEVVGTAEDPYAAREAIKQLTPDVITLDIEMPRMDGLSFLEKIMTLRPMPVVMASTLTTRGAEATIRALELGAVDCIAKPNVTQAEELHVIQHELWHKIRIASTAKVKPLRKAPPVAQLSYSGNWKGIIAIGASTGGVEALREVLTPLPANAPPIIITQHMPERFTTQFAARLDSLCALTVREAKNAMPLKPGMAVIAPGNYHMALDGTPGQWRVKLFEGEKVSGHRPSVDVLFESVAKIAGNHALAAILTGMGKDGAAGLLAMRRAGAHTLGQDEASCVVYGMPRAAKALGGVVKELPLTALPAALLEAAC